MDDAVVIGAGPNGLTAANLLADAGWSVLVLEAQDEPGGAVRSAALSRADCVHDVFSAFYPLAVASPHLRMLDLERWGLRWRHAPVVLAHPLPDGRCAALCHDVASTAESLEAFAPGDGDGWHALYARWRRVEQPLLAALFAPFPPVRPLLRLGARLPPADLLRFVRLGTLPVRRLGEEFFGGEGGPLLLTGNALHADFTPEMPGSGLFGWLLTSIGQHLGYPVPEGGAQALTKALVDRLHARGGRVVCGERVVRVLISDGRAHGVRTASGEAIAARRAVLADTPAETLYEELVGAEHLPPRLVADVQRIQRDNSTVKVDWLLRGPIPWTAEPARRAGTVHLGAGLDELTAATTALARGMLPERPPLVMGQMNLADPTRSPAPWQTVWAYTKVPQRIQGDAGGALTGRWHRGELAAFVARIEAQIERHAPGFSEIIEARHVLGPADLERADENLLGGAVNGGTAQLHQQLVLRPVPGTGRPETPVAGLYLASASAHPGGGVHGGPGANAAHAARLGRLRRRAARGALALLLRGRGEGAVGGAPGMATAREQAR